MLRKPTRTVKSPRSEPPLASPEERKSNFGVGNEKKLILLTNELWELIDLVRGDMGRAEWIEERLWRTTVIIRASRKYKIRRVPRMPKGWPNN